MRWPKIEEIHHHIKVPEGYSLEQLSEAHIPSLIHLLSEWYPDIQVGSESCHLKEEFYHQEVALREVEEDRKIFAYLVKKNDEVAAFCSLEKNNDALTCCGRLGAAAPHHRGMHLGMLGPAVLEAMGRVIGAEMVYYISTLKSAPQQIIAEKSDFQLVGILPAFDRDMISEGKSKRVFEAIYAKVLVTEDEIFFPSEESLTPNTRKLWEFLFKRF